MGVKDLWQLLEPAGRKVNMESLQGKRLAIDASIWLHQFLKAMQDKEGKALANAHLLGFFPRICKLLYHNVKPVFVFDGATPELKRRTIMQRKRRQMDAEENFQRTAKQLLTAQLKMRALQAVHTDEQTTNLSDLTSNKHKRKRDDYDLPPIDTLANSMIQRADPRFVTSHDDEALENMEDMRDFIDRLDTENLDFDSEAFKSLPLEIRYELLQDAKLHSRQTSWQRLRKMTANATNALDFSKQQIKLLMRRNDLTQKYMDLVGQNMGAVSISAHIASDRNRSYVLVKNEDGRSGWSLQFQPSVPNVKEDTTSTTDDVDTEATAAMEAEFYLDNEIGKVENEMMQAIMAKTSNEDKATQEPVDSYEKLLEDDELELNISDYESDTLEPSVDSMLDQWSNNNNNDDLSEEEGEDNIMETMSTDEDDQDFVEVPMMTNGTRQINEENENLNSNETSSVGVLRHWLARVDGQVAQLFPDYLSQMQYDASNAASIEELEDKLASEIKRLGKENTIDVAADVREARPFYRHFLEDLIRVKRTLTLAPQQEDREPIDMTSDQVHHSPSEDIELNLDLSASFLSSDIVTNTNNTKPAPSETTTSSTLLNSPVSQIPNELPIDGKEVADSAVEMKHIEEELSINDNASIPDDASASLAKLVEDTVKRHGEHSEFANQIKQQGAETVKADLAAKVSQLYEQRRKEHRELNQVSNAMIQETMELLQLFGIPYVVAPTEAEAQCATLVQLNLVDGVITDDSDIFLFGGTCVYRHVFQTHRHVECYLTKDIERELFLNRDRLIQLAYLLGSDYTYGISGIGRVTAMEIISEWQGPDGLSAFRDWFTEAEQDKHTASEIEMENTIRRRLRKLCHKITIPQDFPDPRVAKAYQYPVIDDSPESFEWELPDLDGIRWYMSRKADWDQVKVDERVLPIIRRLNELKRESQTQLDRYFRIDSDRLRATQKSSRVRKAVAKLMPDNHSLVNLQRNSVKIQHGLEIVMHPRVMTRCKRKHYVK
ncbi:hypothetical protein BDF22DRAFT_633996 [Syncephalis plumigaleata]|nr:hypothetical protein BDF22DRAFT_633996 [Syncephalis plumigaleata]